MKTHRFFRILSLVLCSLLLNGCGAPAATQAPTETEAAPTEAVVSGNIALKDLYADDFRMGVSCEAISHWSNRLSEIGNPDKENLIKQEFNSITFGNELKPAYNMAYYKPEATETDLPFGANGSAIEMLNWAKENGIPVRGHTLIWHSQCEDEVFCKNYKVVRLGNGTLDPDCLVDAETLKLRMQSYIGHVMEYMYANGFGNVIYAWDVVNEAIEPGHNSDNMRESYWYQIIGAEFLYDAFKFTREAVQEYSAKYADLYGIDPKDAVALKTIQPKLFYNDYNEFQLGKRKAIIAAIQPIAEAGYLDGMGMQGHLSDTSNIVDIINSLKAYSEVVDEVHITELDISQSSSGDKAEYNQGKFYKNLFAALLNAKRDGAKLTCITIWGLTDDNSWKKETKPLIFNGDLTPKLAYSGIVCAKTGEELAEPDFAAPDLSDVSFDFDGPEDADKLGFVKRGDSSLTVQSDVVHSGSGALLVSGRTESWHGVLFDVSRFVGQTIRVKAWVKSEDPSVKLTADIDGKWPNITSAGTASGEWAEINGTYTIPADLAGLSLYFETTGTADIYVDELSIGLAGINEGFEGASHIAAPRGTGHVSKLKVTGTEKHMGKKSLLVTREAQEAGVNLDIGSYVGKKVNISVFVKTIDETIRLGIDGVEGAVVEVASVADGWAQLSGTFTIPADLAGATAYIETNGSANIYVDDFSLTAAE